MKRFPGTTDSDILVKIDPTCDHPLSPKLRRISWISAACLEIHETWLLKRCLWTTDSDILVTIDPDCDKPLTPKIPRISWISAACLEIVEIDSIFETKMKN